MLSAVVGFGKSGAETRGRVERPRHLRRGPTTGVALSGAVDHPDLDAFLAQRHDRIVVDMGCGDARATARIAAAEPTALVVGIDANLDSAERVARRARRPVAKGGLPNLLLVRASAETLPTALTGRADDLRVDLPWGSLLEGLLAEGIEGGVVAVALARLLAPGATVRVTINARALPDGLTRDAAERRLADGFVAAGLADVAVRSTAMPPETGWGKRLASGRPLEVIVGEARRR